MVDSAPGIGEYNLAVILGVSHGSDRGLSCSTFTQTRWNRTVQAGTEIQAVERVTF